MVYSIWPSTAQVGAVGHAVEQVAVGALDDAQTNGGRGDVVPTALTVADHPLVGPRIVPTAKAPMAMVMIAWSVRCQAPRRSKRIL